MNKQELRLRYIQLMNDAQQILGRDEAIDLIKESEVIWKKLSAQIVIYLLSISVTSPCPQTTIEELGIKNLSIWTCEDSSFDWTYYDKETCLLLDGEVMVTPWSRTSEVWCR